MTQTTPPKHLVLYADDDRDDISLVEEAFSSIVHNIELITAYNGVDALVYLDNLSTLDPVPCLIILDINMPKLNGKETLLKIREKDRFSKIPVVLFSTSSMLSDKHFAEKYGAGFVTKPLNAQQMKEITHLFIDHCTDEVKRSVIKRF